MDAARSPPRRPGRNISHPMPRRPTAGPLDITDDPLSAAPVDQDPIADGKKPSIEIDLDASATVNHTITRPGPVPIPASLRFLQNPVSYHQIPRDEVPQAFLSSKLQPPLNASLAELLKYGHFRRAAEVAVQELVDSRTIDLLRAFQLVYCRLACLTLISRVELAVDEGLPLLDNLTSNASGIATMLEIVPWELRVLLVRLLSIGAEDGGRRAIMALYSLAGEARSRIRNARSAQQETTGALWVSRLDSIGLYVADTLVTMGEYETAYRHLDSLAANSEDAITRRVLLSIKAGSLTTAKELVTGIQTESQRDTYEALIDVAGRDVSKAIEIRQADRSGDLDEMQLHNRAIFMLYAGDIDSATELLQGLTAFHPVFHNLLFNLSTMYELCGERADLRKSSLVETLAGTPARPESLWERTTLDFKL